MARAGHQPPALPANCDAVAAFLAGDQVGTLTTLRPDGCPHVTPVRFTWDAPARLARVLTVDSTRKVRNLVAAPESPAVLCQAVGFRWATLEGRATVSADPARIQAGVRRYAERYHSPPPAPPGRVVIEIAVDRIYGLNL